MSVPRSATICPYAPSWTASIAPRPNRVASTRSNAVGVPPRCTCPSTTARDSLPVRFSTSSASSWPIPPSRTCPKASRSPVAVAIVPSLGVAPSATTMIGE